MTTVLGAVRPGPFVSLAVAAYFAQAVLPVGLQAGAAWARRRAHRDGGDAGAQGLDGVTVVIPAHREATALRGTVAHLLAQGVSPRQILVMVDEDEVTADAARSLGVLVDFSPVRRGKSGALNDAVRRCQDCAAVVCLDANVEVSLQALVAVATPVARGEAAVVSGVKTERGNLGEGLYWRFEAGLVAAENALGGSLAVVGELLALRPSAYRPVPPLGVNDDQWIAVDAALRGLPVRVETTAHAVEDAASPHVQRERRARIAAGVLRLLWHRRADLARSRSPQVGMFLLHKGWRLTVGPSAQVGLVLYCATHVRSSWLARAVVAGHAMGVAAYAAPPATPDGRLPAPVRLAQTLAAQAVGMPLVVSGVGLWRAARDPYGDPRWRTVSR